MTDSIRTSDDIALLVHGAFDGAREMPADVLAELTTPVDIYASPLGDEQAQLYNALQARPWPEAIETLRRESYSPFLMSVAVLRYYLPACLCAALQETNEERDEFQRFSPYLLDRIANCGWMASSPCPHSMVDLRSLSHLQRQATALAIGQIIRRIPAKKELGYNDWCRNRLEEVCRQLLQVGATQ